MSNRGHQPRQEMKIREEIWIGTGVYPGKIYKGERGQESNDNETMDPKVNR